MHGMHETNHIDATALGSYRVIVENYGEFPKLGAINQNPESRDLCTFNTQNVRFT